MPFVGTALNRLRSLPALPVLARLRHLADLHRSRRALARLDDRMLRDIGLTRSDVQAELDRRPWDAPPHWRG